MPVNTGAMASTGGGGSGKRRSRKRGIGLTTTGVRYMEGFGENGQVYYEVLPHVQIVTKTISVPVSSNFEASNVVTFEVRNKM